MNWTFTPFAAPLFVGAAAMLVLMVWAWRRRGTPGVAYLLLLCVALAFYSVGYAFELGSLTVDGVRFWFKIEYLGIPFLPGLLTCLILDYLGYRRWLNPISLTAVFFIPMITLVLGWTNETHQLVWQNMSIDREPGFTLTTFDRGPWYIVYNVFVYLQVFAMTFIAIRAFVRATGLFKRQVVFLLVAVLVPTIVNIAYQSRLVFPGLDLNPFGQLIAAGLVSWGILNFRLLDVAPVAQEAVVQSMADAVLVFDSRQRLVSANPAALNLLESPTLSIGKTFAELFAGWPDVLGAGSGQSRREELPLNLKGVERVHNVTATPLASQPGQAAGQVLVARDVTTEVRTQRALIETNFRLEALRVFDASLSQELSVKHVVDVAADAALRLAGADGALLVEHGPEGFRVLKGLGGYESMKPGALLEGSAGILGRVVRSRQPDLTLDTLNDPDYVARIATTRALITLPLLSGDRLLGVLALESADPAKFTGDVMEAGRLLAARIASAFDNARIYEERDQLVRELDSFAHTVAHNLKNPLGVIRGYAELLALVQMPETGKMYAERIHKGAAQAFEIIEALLLLAEPRALDEAKIGAVLMDSPVNAALGRLAPLIEQHAARVATSDNWPVVRGYAPWVEELWVNYISNALKYGGEPPQVTLGWDKQPDGKLRFWTQDNGRGLAPEEMAKLFHPFVRLDQERAEGHGLGLTIVQRIVKRLGGAVGIESAPGKDSKFYFTLPPDKD